MSSLAQPDIQSGYAETADGVRIAYQTSGEGPAFVCCHPMAWDQTVWEAHRSAFSRQHKLISFDQRGAGDSEHPPFSEGPDSAYSVETFGEDLRAVLDKLGIETATLLGFSMGAIPVLSFAIRSPERVERLILGSAMASRLPQAIIERARLVEEVLDRDGIEATYDFYFSGSLFEDAMERGHFREQFARVRSKATADGFKGCFRVTIDRPSLIEQLSVIEAPALVIVGERDTHYLPEADRIVASLPNATKRIIADAGHPIIMQQPAAFESAVLEFLS